jgi:hypothetical protein
MAAGAAGLKDQVPLEFRWGELCEGFGWREFWAASGSDQ